MNPLLKKLVRKLVTKGRLKVTDPAGNIHEFGDGTGRTVHVMLKSRRAEAALLLDPALKLGECYMNGDLDLVEGDIFGLLELVLSDGSYVAGASSWLRTLARFRRTTRHLARRNSPYRSRRNVSHHYDLPGALYDLFLDADRQYSCAYYRDAGMTLDEAQHAKKQHIAAKLFLERERLTVLDIGSGWGGLGLHLAREHGADVTGITLSREQQAHSTGRITEAERQRVRFLLQDYRSLDTPFDRIVSVGMFEHVGQRNYDVFFETCARLLKKDGVMLLHSIGRSAAPSWANPFIARYIFPGGYIPSLSEVMPAIERSGLYVTDIEILRLHYARTLRAWRERFMANREEARRLYGERFCRMWEFYLAASEAGFHWQHLMVFQIQLVRDQATLPLTRDYMVEAERDSVRRSPGQDEEDRPRLVC